MRALRAFVPFVALSCSAPQSPSLAQSSPGLVFDTPIAEGKGDTEGPAPAPRPTESARPPAQAAAPPDPEPLRQREQYEYALRYAEGRVSVTSVRAVTYPQPIVTARRMGRFALELWVGKELVERVRFDFPMLAAEEPARSGPAPITAPPSLTDRSVLTTVIVVPQSSRARTALLIDRATGYEESLPYPPP
jgi:hypothetical protein